MRELMVRPNFRIWLALLGAITLIISAAYTLVQQDNRLSANDWPQAAAQATKQQLNQSNSPKNIVPAIKANLREDIFGFVIITNDKPEILASSAYLDNGTPLPPAGVFDFAKAHGQDHFTWQPTAGVRLATYVLSYKTGTGKGFIIAGQSLKPTEDIVDTYGILAIAAWIATASWITFVLLTPFRRSKK